jgi:hypothetical protein
VKKVFANVLPANVTMLHMFRKRNFSISLNHESAYAEIDLEPNDLTLVEDIEEPSESDAAKI